MSAKISFIEAILVDLPTIRDHQLAMTTMQRQTLVIVRLRCSDGMEGLGEATTIGGLTYGDESPEGIKLAIDTYLAPALIGIDATNVNAAMQRLAKVARGNRFAKSAVETALLDAQAKRLGVPLVTMLGGAVRSTLSVLWTLASGDTARDIEEAEMMLAESRHNTFKLKIGRRSVREDSDQRCWERSETSTYPVCRFVAQASHCVKFAGQEQSSEIKRAPPVVGTVRRCSPSDD